MLSAQYSMNSCWCFTKMKCAAGSIKTCHLAEDPQNLQINRISSPGEDMFFSQSNVCLLGLLIFSLFGEVKLPSQLLVVGIKEKTQGTCWACPHPRRCTQHLIKIASLGEASKPARKALLLTLH